MYRRERERECVCVNAGHRKDKSSLVHLRSIHGCLHNSNRYFATKSGMLHGVGLVCQARPASEARTLDIPSLPMWSEVPGRKDAAMGLRAHLMWTVTNAIKDWTMCG